MVDLQPMRLVLVLGLCLSCTTRTGGPEPQAPGAGKEALLLAPDIPARLRRLPATPIDFDRTLLDERDRRVLASLIEASRSMDAIFLRQVWQGNPDLRRRLDDEARTGRPGAGDALALFRIHAGPWDRLDENEPFVGRRPKPPGAGLYPEDLTRAEFEAWIAAHPGDRAAFESPVTVIRRSGKDLVAVPYSREYGDLLAVAGARLREAAALTGEPSLRDYLTRRADAFSSDDYYASDIAWMDLKSDIEVVIGPYEVYEDHLFNYKAAFEAFVTVRDRAESEKLEVYAGHLRDMERNLPIPDEHKNLDRGFESPIRVVQEVFTAGDARRGVQTAAFNLPNDERVREAKGSKKVLLKNVMEAKFRQSGRPVAERVLERGALSGVAFEPFFNQTLFHELAHGIGPGLIAGPDGKKVDTRLLLKNLYSAIEECKADVVGVWNLLWAIDRKLLTSFDEASLFATDAGLMFRSMRFGIDEAHGRGTAVQWNWYRERGAIVPAEEGRFRIDGSKFRQATRSLATELLMIEATGDFVRAQKLLDAYGKTTPEIESVNARLSDVPVDIAPVFIAAGETGARPAPTPGGRQ